MVGWTTSQVRRPATEDDWTNIISGSSEQNYTSADFGRISFTILLEISRATRVRRRETRRLRPRNCLLRLKQRCYHDAAADSLAGGGCGKE